MFAKVKPNTQFIGQNILYFSKVDSTNNILNELSKNNLVENGSVVIADFQTTGKGQRNKTWDSNAYENLLFSIFLKPVTTQVVFPFKINKIMTYSVLMALKKQLESPLELKIKWPNDIYFGNKKISGILIENNYSGSTLNHSIVGIGVNVNQFFESKDKTSLAEITSNTIDRLSLLEQILEEIEEQYLKFSLHSNQAINLLFNESLLGYNEESEFEINNEILKGELIGVNENGQVIVSISGVNTAFNHGEIKQIFKN